MTTEAIPFFASPCWQRTRALWQRLARLARRSPRDLRLRESLPLGEHRFVAVIEFERRRLLISGTPSSLVLLAHLGSGPDATTKDPSELACAQPAGIKLAETRTAGACDRGPRTERMEQIERIEERKQELF